jgi:hypothetical protein
LIGNRSLSGHLLWGTGLNSSDVFRVDLNSGAATPAHVTQAYEAPVLTSSSVAYTTISSDFVQLSRANLRQLAKLNVVVSQADNQAPFGYDFGFGHVWIVGFTSRGVLLRVALAAG